MEIGEPVVLRKLPRPAHGSGKVHFGSIWALRPQSKRKRHEICTAVDGDSVNIYDIKTGRISFSHAVPPSAVFACAPTSVRWKEGDQVFRQTCFAVRDDGLSLTSVVGKDTTDHDSRVVNSLRLEDESASPVLHIDISSTGNERRIAIIQADGTLTFSAPDLQHTASLKLRDPAGSALSTGTDTVQLITATILTLADAQKSVLKSRDDLSRQIPTNSCILVAVSTSSLADQSPSHCSDLRCRAWSISNPMSADEPQILFDFPLPLDAYTKSKKASALIASFGPRASTLILKSAIDLQRIELTGLVPRTLPTSRLGQTAAQDVLLIGSGAALAAFQDSFRLIDLQYNTVYASLDLNQTLLRKKRKRSGSDLPGSAVDFVGYFPQINRVLIFSRNHLIACDLSFKESRRGPTGAPLLVDQIGRGAFAPAHRIELDLDVGANSALTSTTREWANARETLTALRRTADHSEFEKAALAFWKECSSGDQPDPADSHYSASALTEQQVDFILSSLFSLKSAAAGEEQTPAQLQLDLIAPTLICSLNKAGLLSTPRLKRALSTSSHPHGPNLNPLDLPTSLMAADATYATLVAYVDSFVSANPSDIAAVVRVLARRILQHNNSSTQALLTSSAHSELTGGEICTTDKIDGASPSMDILAKVISKALTALGLLDTKTISTQIRTFSQPELSCLIQFLRRDLYQRGQASLGSRGQISDRVPLEVGTILKILAACIDAIDPLDLISGEGGQFLEGVITDLLSEVSLATDAAEESANIQGTLRETLRYHQSDNVARGKAKKLLQGPSHTNTKQLGIITTLYTEDMDGTDFSSQVGILPLGLCADDGLNSVKARKGGRQLSERTPREKRMLRSQQMGPYRFERLVL